MTNGAANPQEDFPPLATGIYLTVATAAVINVVSFVGLPRALALVVLAVAAMLLVGGLVAHLTIQRAWSRRNAGHRAWLASTGSMDLMDFRLRLLRREVEVEHARQNWVRPFVATLLLGISALVVPYEMLMSQSAGSGNALLVELWVFFSLLLALVYATLAVRASVRQQRAELDVDRTPTSKTAGIDA